MASDDKSTEPTAISEDNEVADVTSSCLNDPNYAIICVFLQKFGSHLKIEHPNFLRLQKMIEDTDEVHEELKQFFVRLLRKTRKSVQPDKLDSALAKFCYTYSVQDAWEVERFGYKRSSLVVKLRILKEVLESQFDKNPNFRTLVSAQSATELRSQPLGKDKLGNAYWSTIDDQCNLRIYQEHLDEEIWKVVATNRDEMAKLIACLRGNEVVLPSLVDIIDEDSSSNSMPPKVDALENENGASNGSSNGTENGNEKEAIANLKIKLNTENGSESTVEQIQTTPQSNDNTNGSAKKSTPTGLDDEDDGNTSVMSEIDEFSQAASESSATTIGTKSNETQGSKRITLLSSKPPSHNKLRLRISNKRNMEMDSDTTENCNKRPSMLGARKSRYQESEEDFESDLSDEELGSEEMSNEDDECGSAIEEPMMLVQGEGYGHANKCKNIRFPEDSESGTEDDGIGEAIEEEMFFVFGEGSGLDCDVGNNDVKAKESTTASSAEVTPAAVTPRKPMFFFGQPGCLKLSPMRTAVSTPPLNEKINDSDNIVPETDKSNEETSNDSNLIALEGNSLSNDVEENAATDKDETDKATISNINQELSLSESCESETKIELQSSQLNEVDNDLNKVSNESIKKNDRVVSGPNDTIETNKEQMKSETNKKIIDTKKSSKENKIEVNRSDESTSCINNSHVNAESIDAVSLKSDQVQDDEHGSDKNDLKCGKNEEIPSNSEIGGNVESDLNKRESEITEPIEHKESAMSTREDLECNDQNSLSESKIEDSSVVEDIVPVDEVQTNVPNAENSKPSVSEIETKNETELEQQQELETNPEMQPKENQQLNEVSDQESSIAASENELESMNEPVEELSEQISGKLEGEHVESTPQQTTAQETNVSQVDVSQQNIDIPDLVLEEKPSRNETARRDYNDQSPIPSESVTSEVDETLQTEESSEYSDSVDLKAIESCIISKNEPEKEALGTPDDILDQVSNKPTTSALTISQEINKKDQTPAEVTTTECPGSIKEKRKSIDQIEDPVICKRVYICGEKDLDEVKPEPSLQNEILTKPNEITQTVLPLPETLSNVEPVSLEEPFVQNELVAAVTLAEKNEEEVTREKQMQAKIAKQSACSQGVNEIDQLKPDRSSQIIQSIPEIVEEKVESIAAPKENKSKTVPKSASPSAKAAQSRTRKRRISGEKPRHSSESEMESPLSQDQSSDEEVGGKRIKMRAKVVQKSVRKSIEHKRNVKNTDWSSDDNEKPNAKRATGDVLKQTESSVLDMKKESEPVNEDPIKVDPTKGEPVKDEPEQHSDEKQVAISQRRSGRPARKAKKPPAPRATRSKAAEETNQTIKEEDMKKEEKLEEKPTSPAPVQPKPEGRRKKRSLMGLDIDEIESVQAAADETPVRQSRRIAQLKIREEADRRKAEEVALHKMKEASEKKKKGSTKAPQSESEEENSESEAKLEKKKKKKKGNKDQPWQTDSDVPSERDEEDNYDHEDHERLPPLGSDHEFSPESDIEDESQIVPTKRARTARKDKTEKKTEEESEEEDVHACQKCSKNDHPEWILLCDKCDKGYHCSCLIPVLFIIPEGEWFCPTCQQEKLIDALQVRLADYDALIKHKEAEEAQRQRLMLNTVNETNIIKDTKRDRQRARAQISGSSDESSESSAEGSEVENENESRDRRAKTRQKNRQRKRSESDESELSKNSSDDTSDNEPIYKLRKRRQANVSYRFNEYDELINRAIKSEMDEVAGAGNLGRGKDISTIMEADKEEKRLKKLEQQQKDRDDNESDEQPLPKSGKDIASDGSDSEPIRPRVVNRSKNAGRKKKKLNSLDDDSDEADSDDDFKETSSENSSDSEESEESDSSMDSLVRKRNNKNGRFSTRRSNRERKKRFDADFIDDDSFDEEDNKPLVKKKKKKIDSDFSDFNESSDSSKIDSEDLCDDSTDESDKPWSKSEKPKSKLAPKSNNKGGKNESDEDRPFKGKTMKKKSRISNDEDDDEESDEDSQEDLPKIRRTRGKKLPYLVDDDFDSSDDGIKPGVKRPDTPPEERAAFIKKQEEIKRMLAEKSEAPEKPLRNPLPTKASLSTIPLQVIQTAKALDVDLKKSAITHRNGSDNDSNGFDDDLPEDFDPEDMDEDAITKMMEEEDLAQQQLKLADETTRNQKNSKDSEIPKKLELPTKLSVDTAAMAPVVVPPALVSPLPFPSTLTIPDIPPSMYTSQIQTTNTKIAATPKKRGRKTKDDILPMLDNAIKAARGISEQFLSKEQINPSLSAIQYTSTIPPSKSSPLGLPPPLQRTPASQMFSPHVASAIQHTSSVIAHSSVIQQRPLPSIIPPSSTLGISLNQQPIIPSTILDVQNTRLLDPSELGKPPVNISESPIKKRGRRKKVTPLRESISSPPNAAVSPSGVSMPISIPNVPKITSILSERLSAGPGDKAGLSIATPPQLFSPSNRSQPSVIQRLARPPQQRLPPFTSSGPSQVPPQRYFSSNAPLPPHSLPSSVSHSRPTYHAPNVTVSAGHRPNPLVPPSHGSGHLPHPMYMRGQHGLYSGYPNIQPPPIHSGSPQNFTAGPYQNPFSNYYAAAAAAVERRSGAIMSHTLEPYDNKSSPSTHERMTAYAHSSLTALTSLSTRNPTNPAAETDDERHGPGNAPGNTPGSSEFSGLVSYFSSQQDDLDS